MFSGHGNSDSGQLPSPKKHERRQGIYWIGTIPAEGDDSWNPTKGLPEGVVYLRGQRERGGETGYEHFQILVVLGKKGSLRTLTNLFGTKTHFELTRSKAADEYVWKEDTAVPGTQFELGQRPFKRNSATDWQSVLDSAKSGKLADIPPDVQIRYHFQLNAISRRYLNPSYMERTCDVRWGVTHSGKSRAAYIEAPNAYRKDPSTKWWCGYDNQDVVVIEEFRGKIGIEHLLRWLDPYPLLVEPKGGYVAANFRKVIITSNLHPRQWYPELDNDTWLALRRRLHIIHHWCSWPYKESKPATLEYENDSAFPEI